METRMIYSKVISIATVGFDKAIDFYNRFLLERPNNEHAYPPHLAHESVVDSISHTNVDDITDTFYEIPCSPLKQLIGFIVFKNNTPTDASSGIVLKDNYHFNVEDFASVLKAVYLDPSQVELQVKLLPLLESLLPEFSQFNTPILLTDQDFAKAALFFSDQLTRELFQLGSLNKFENSSHKQRLLDLLHFSRLVQFDDSRTNIFLTISYNILQLTLGRFAYHDYVSSVLCEDIKGVTTRKDMRNAVLFLEFLQNSLPTITATELAKNWRAIYSLFNPLLLRPSQTRVILTTRHIYIGDGLVQSKAPIGKISSERPLLNIKGSILKLIDRYISDIHRYNLGDVQLNDRLIESHDDLIKQNDETYKGILHEHYFNKYSAKQHEFSFPRTDDNPYFKEFRDSLLGLGTSTTLEFPDKPTRFLLSLRGIFIFDTSSNKSVKDGIFFPNFSSGTNSFSEAFFATLPPPLIITFDRKQRVYYLAIKCDFVKPTSLKK